MSGDGSTKIFTIKNPEKYDFINTASTFDSRYITLEILECDAATSIVPCAAPEDRESYIKNHRIGIVTATNYIDYGEVDPYKGPLKSAFQWIEFDEILLNDDFYTYRRISLREHQVSL